MSRKLKPPKNYRYIRVRSCKNCIHCEQSTNGWAWDYVCLRDPDIAGDARLLIDEPAVCDLFKWRKVE